MGTRSESARWLVRGWGVLVVGLVLGASPGCGGDGGGGTTPDASGGRDATGGDGSGGMDAASDAMEGSDATGTDSTADDAGSQPDASGGTDASDRTDSGDGADASGVDAGPRCGATEFEPGSCAHVPGTECLSCPAGGPRNRYLCTTRCRRNEDCRDRSRPVCNRPERGDSEEPGICTPRDFTCAWGAVCASPHTPVATADGERPLASIRPGDLVYSLHEGRLQLVPVLRVGRTPVTGHHVVRVELESGRYLEMSAGHPTADGRPFAQLRPGDRLGERVVRAVSTVPYDHDATYDLLPDSDSGTYVAAGALVGSTLR
ncbi:MAG: Hint domain-containing protein [Myxococcota bacterium]|nr:Hint domain-containing protein [Myxococcota bacterium]MDW8361922.1 Hint domain-containing protein [Myxococcales bacterium]